MTVILTHYGDAKYPRNLNVPPKVFQDFYDLEGNLTHQYGHYYRCLSLAQYDMDTESMSNQDMSFIDYSLKFVSGGLWEGGVGLETFRVKHGLSTKRDSKILRVRKPELVFEFIKTAFSGKNTQFLEKQDGLICYSFADQSSAHLVPDLVIRCSVRTGGVAVSATGAPDQVDVALVKITDAFQDESVSVTQVDGVGSYSIDTTERFIYREETRLAKPEFYPYLRDTPTNLYKEYMESDKSILLLIGPAGTGKTTILRNLIMYNKNPDAKTYLTTSSEITRDRKFMSWFSSEVKDNTMFVFEDADDMIGHREEGNSELNVILGAGDGVFKHDTKIIISTNLASLKRVDSALTRPGRAFDILQFRALTPTEANVARESIGLPPIDFPKDVTLAEALNYRGQEDIVARKAPTMGFAVA